MLLWKILCYFKDNLKTTILYIVGTTVWHYQDYKAILSRGREGKHSSFFFFLSFLLLFFFFLHSKALREFWKIEITLSTLVLKLVIFFLFPERHDFIAFDNTERGTFYLIIGTKDWSQNPKHNLNFDIDFPSGLGGKKTQLFP